MEEWRDIPGYSKYQVSNLGNIRRDGKVLKKRINRGGYEHVSLSVSGVATNKRVHRLVACTFIPNLENRGDVDHFNGKRNDNRVENLKWATRSENKRNPNTPQPLGCSKERYIHARPGGTFNVWVNTGSHVFRKNFKTLPEAIAARDAFLLDILGN